MSFLQRLMSGGGGLQAAADPTDDIWYGIAGTDTMAGLRVTPAIALEVSTVFACVKVISESLAILPLVVYERVNEKEKARAYRDPVYRLLHKLPNGWQTPFEFKELLTRWAVLYGNGIALKVFDATQSEVVALLPVHPDLVRTEQLRTGELRYHIRQPDGTETVKLQGEVLHLRGPSTDGIDGMNLSKMAREAIALARAMESFGARYFANDTTVGVVIEHPGQLSKDAHQRLKDSLAADGGWQNAHKAKILEEGMKLTRTLVQAKDAQLLEGRAHEVVEICRFWRVPPHKVQHLANATFSNIEHQAIEFVTDTIQPWATRWEQVVTRDLIVEDDRYFAEFLMAALLRGDNAARAQYYRERFYLGTLSRNDIRALENEGPVEGGDVFYVQGATVPLDANGHPMLPAAAPAPAGPARARDPEEERRASPREAVPAAPVPAPPAPRRSPARAVFKSLLSDAAERIAKAETRELEKRADRAIEDYTRFASWVEEFYAAHLHYAAKTLQPIAEAWTAHTGAAIDVPMVALRLKDHGRAIALSAEFCQAPKQVIERKPEAVLQILTDTFTWDD